MYADFAQVYDRLMQDVDYAGWAAYYGGLLKGAGINSGALVTECACGTGSLSIHLSETYSLTGLDISQEMLSIAAVKLRRHGRQVPLVRQDMRHLRLHKLQDAILATCDGVNYLQDELSLQRFLESAYAHLKPGGVLCFDVSSICKLSTILGCNTLTSTQGDVHYIWYNHWDEKEQLLSMELHLYVKACDGNWQYLKEYQQQRGWSAEELTDQLQRAGFCDITVFGDRTFTSAHSQSPRLHIFSQKLTDKKEMIL